MKPTQCTEHLVSTMDTAGLVPFYHGISRYSAEYASIYFQLFME